MPLGKVPHITILRPAKGLDAFLYECLAATFRQDYPREKLTIYFCISSRNDPALSVLQRVLADFPGFDAKIFIEDEDPFLQDQPGSKAALGPNPKIRNMSRGYREAKEDIIWVLDCNVWVGRGAAGRMVDKLCGLDRGTARTRRYKFVHQLPLVVHVNDEDQMGSRGSGSGRDGASNKSKNDLGTRMLATLPGNIMQLGKKPSAGAKLEEMFMSSAHAKFYTAINTVLIAPCILGKSNMFRRSHLDHLTASDPARPAGIDYFSRNICEDHLIGDLLWYGKVPGEVDGEPWGKHALVYGDLAIQPMMRMSLQEYVARRIRWLRVRKFTVTLATLVEPGTESLLCSLYGAYAFATFATSSTIGQLAPYWALLTGFWFLSVTLWATVDRYLYLRLHDARCIEVDEHTPPFVLPRSIPRTKTRRGWIYTWLGREVLAFPIWAWAMFGGTTVHWRGRRFWVSTDMTVHEMRDDDEQHATLPRRSTDKDRRVKHS